MVGLPRSELQDVAVSGRREADFVVGEPGAAPVHAESDILDTSTGNHTEISIKRKSINNISNLGGPTAQTAVSQGQ